MKLVNPYIIVENLNEHSYTNYVMYKCLQCASCTSPRCNQNRHVSGKRWFFGLCAKWRGGLL